VTSDGSKVIVGPSVSSTTLPPAMSGWLLPAKSSSSIVTACVPGASVPLNVHSQSRPLAVQLCVPAKPSMVITGVATGSAGFTESSTSASERATAGVITAGVRRSGRVKSKVTTAAEVTVTLPARSLAWMLIASGPSSSPPVVT
jgi:hypothetical protein